MAVSIERLNKNRHGHLVARPSVFQRGERALSLRKNRRRRTIRTAHILTLVLVFAGFFLAFQKAYVFLISWEELAIRTVRIRCGYAPLGDTMGRLFDGRRLGNILLFDIGALQRSLRTIPWVKEARVRKVFPSSIVVEVQERKPFAILDSGGFFLTDEDGTVLEKLTSIQEWPLPVVRMESARGAGRAELWEAARSILMNLPSAERKRLESLTCSEYGEMSLRFMDDPVRIIVDGEAIAPKLSLFRNLRPGWESRFGPLSSADLRFSDRVILRPFDQVPGGPSVIPDKEAR